MIAVYDRKVSPHNNFLYNNLKVNKKQNKITKKLFIVEKSLISVINSHDVISILWYNYL